MAWLSLMAALFLAGGLVAWALPAGSRLAPALGAGGALLGSAAGLLAAVPVLLGAPSLAATLPWTLPLGTGALGLDPLSAWFLVAILLVAGLAAPYGAAYLAPESGHRPVAATWLPYNLLVLSLAAVVLARDGLVLLLAWEGMTLSSFALVVFDHDRPEVRRAGFLYLVAGHAGAACLMALFLLLDDGSGTLAFPAAGTVAASTPAFALALLGFGLKAGLWPLHAWLPEAHAAAPTHVSALLSGVLLKAGVYGLVRTLAFFDQPPRSWALVLLGLGAASAVAGILHALAQRDLKRLLAWSSVENVGLVALGLGLSLAGRAAGIPGLAWLGMAAALLHVLNHALFKSLLFLSAGAVLRATGTRELDRLGGLLRRMPRTGWPLLAGVLAVAGVPPLNGFVGEVLLLAGGLQGLALADATWLRAGALAVLWAVPLAAGLALAAFAKVFGIAFLGEPRSPEAAAAAPVRAGLWVSPAVLAAACLAIGLLPAGALSLVTLPVLQAVPAALPAAGTGRGLLGAVGAVGAALLAGLGVLVAARGLLARRRPPRSAVTWDCGYVAPDARMQYTATSFARPLVEGVEGLVGVEVSRGGPSGPFPPPGSLLVGARDRVLQDVLRPGARAAARALSLGRVFQQGSVQAYLLYLLVALLALLVAWMEV